MKMRVLFVLCAALALTVGVATATAGTGHGNGHGGKGGNSANAKLCQKGGWKTFVRADQTPFKNQGACVSYAAKGGVLTAPKTQSQLDCEAAGGVFSTDPATDLSGLVGGTFLWSCHGPNVAAASGTLSNDCNLDGGTTYGVTGIDPTVPSCKGP
jgi:hypothetical protein